MKRHALIVGGTKGLGRPLALKWAAEGRAVSVIGRSGGDAEVKNVRSWAADVLDADSLGKALDGIVAESGPVDDLAFFQRYRGKGDAWNGELEAGPGAVMAVIERLEAGKALAPKGSIVIVGSAAARFVAAECSLGYQVAKAALEQMVRYYAARLAPHGIRVNGVCPATTIKEESREFYRANKPLEAMYREIVPLGRLGTSEELAEIVSFLAGPQAGLITGQNIVVDGGMSLVWQESLARRLSGIKA